MPDFIDLTMRVRKEKLGDLVTELPSYCQPIRWDIVREVDLQPKIPMPRLGAPETIKKPRMRRRWRTVPENIISEAKALRKEGMKVKAIATKLNISESSVYHAMEK
jgi:hypothetical protein